MKNNIDGSDINVGSIDEDINLIEQEFYLIEDAIYDIFKTSYADKINKSLQNIIDKLKEDEVIIIQQKSELENENEEIEISDQLIERQNLEINNLKEELETYKKIAEKLAYYIWKYDCCEYEIGKNGKCEGYYIDKDCTEKCIIDWARKEVEKDIEGDNV